MLACKMQCLGSSMPLLGIFAKSKRPDPHKLSHEDHDGSENTEIEAKKNSQ